MTGGFDEWVVARTPSLLAFAAVLTGVVASILAFAHHFMNGADDG